ncbi:hypothetical protein [Hymenobacter sp. CRA2]|uniref:hypothetical protein n=1 Tax=Hymenobacter sp. CRA2 TaxID=1955620 RepID=UPI0011160F49|nr:hypothetical protein [Hymenobacter sp. CRA2]
MGKLLCNCGHVIVDQTDDLSYKANLLPDQHQEFLYEILPNALAGLVKATQEGRRTDWIRQNFSEGYPTDLTDESLIADLISRYYVDVSAMCISVSSVVDSGFSWAKPTAMLHFCQRTKRAATFFKVGCNQTVDPSNSLRRPRTNRPSGGVW